MVVSINRLSKRLADQKLASVESQLLLRTVIEHIDVAIIALDSQNTVRLINPSAQKLLQIEKQETSPQLMNHLRQVQTFSSGHNQVLELSFGQQKGKFNVHVETYREGGEEQSKGYSLLLTLVRFYVTKSVRLGKTWYALLVMKLTIL